MMDLKSISSVWGKIKEALKKIFGSEGQSSTQSGIGNIAVQATAGSQVHLHVGQPSPVIPAGRPSLSDVEVRLLRTARAHQGLLPLMRETMSGRRAYVGPFGGEALECDRELEHLVDLNLLRRESSASSTIKFRLTSPGWDLVDALDDEPKR